MRHEQLTGEVQERAALYALGILDPAEAAAFEAHLAEGCRACRAEVRAFAGVTSHLGFAASPARPRPEVRDRLLARARATSDAPEWTIAHVTEGAWEAGDVPGSAIQWLFRDTDTQRFTAVARMEAGASYPGHRHADTEELYLLTGDLTVEGQVLRPGDYCAASAGTVHGGSSTRGGCTFLLHASTRDQLTDEAAPARQEGLLFVRAGEGTWEQESAESVMRRLLRFDPARGTRTALVRMARGARLPRHRHRMAEQFYMLEGDAHVSGQVLYAGDYYRVPAGTVHDVTHTESGCLFLLISSNIEVLA